MAWFVYLILCHGRVLNHRPHARSSREADRVSIAFGYEAQACRVDYNPTPVPQPLAHNR